MATFTLVHGSTQNAAGWARLSSVLRARGHAVATPDLPKHALHWGFEEYAREIARSVVEPGTVVVGHSLSGAFLPIVPSMHDCALLVFLAAMIPEPGKSARDQYAEDQSMFSHKWVEAAPRWADTSKHERLAREFLFHDCDESALAWALGTVELLDARHLFTQPHPLTRWPLIRTASIVAARDRTLSAAWGRRMSREVLGTEAIGIDAGHCPHVSQPEALANILEDLIRPQPR